MKQAPKRKRKIEGWMAGGPEGYFIFPDARIIRVEVREIVKRKAVRRAR